MNRILRTAASAVLAMCVIAPVDAVVIAPDFSKAAGSQWKLYNVDLESVDMAGRKVAHLVAQGDSGNGIAGLALTGVSSFTTGSVEIDLKGKNVKLKSFLGVAFNVIDDKTFEAIYFRPFNFKATDEFRDRAVQYIAWPDNIWEKLRKSQPGKFEAAITPVPDPHEWFHARIEIGETRVQVYVNGSKTPCLSVDRLATAQIGRPVALWVDVSDGFYANMIITPSK